MSDDAQPRNPAHDSTTRSEPATKPTRQELRRRILRAAAGAPVILTLPSGKALAGSSSCFGKADPALDPPEPLKTSEPTDPSDWVYTPVKKLRFTPGNSENNYWEGYQLDGRYYRVACDGNTACDIRFENAVPDNYTGGPTGECYWLLAEYPSGTPIPHTTEDFNDYTIIKGDSCWNSLDGPGIPSCGAV